MIQLSDEDILRRLTDTEDGTVERKTAGDYRDCLKTVAGFSNSLPVGDPGIIFVGVGNDGTVQDNNNLDSLQRNVSKELSRVYPPVYAQMKVLRDSTGKEFLAVIVRGSQNRPHFAGPSYVRDGSQTVEASREQFEWMIAERGSKASRALGFSWTPNCGENG
jgi:predicted HTH transcriptional regulator